MPATRGTRRGNGPGHGGPAKGGGNRPAQPFTAENQPPPEAKSAGWEVAAEIRQRIAERRHELLNAQFARALDTQHPQGHQAAADLLNRVMPPIEKREVSGASGGPLSVEVAIVRHTASDP
jgi:hypothetical protein